MASVLLRYLIVKLKILAGNNNDNIQKKHKYLITELQNIFVVLF